jgi:hypothetical protein
MDIRETSNIGNNQISYNVTNCVLCEEYYLTEYDIL